MHPSRRDPERERRERDRYAILLHLAALAEDGTPAVARPCIERALALCETEAHALLEGLVHHEMVNPVGGGMFLALSPLGRQYVHFGAGRRRSIRFSTDYPERVSPRGARH